MNNSGDPISAFAWVSKICWLLAGATGAALAQQVIIGAQTQNLQTGVAHHTITGIVENAVSGEPVRRALVQGWSQRQISVLTGADGRFQMADVPEGILNLTAQKPGFFDARSVPGFVSTVGFQGFTVGSGKNDFKLLLYPAARIFGHAKDKEGEPIGGMPVQVLAEEIDGGRKYWQLRNTSQTEDDGAFEIVDLIPGKYRILTNGHAEPDEAGNSPNGVFRPVYFPNAPDADSAEVIELQAGQEFRADFSLKSEHGYRVSVQVSGLPAQGAAPMIENESGTPIQIGFMNFDQRSNTWTLGGVASGNWTLFCFANDSQGHQYQGRRDIAVNHADLDGVQLVLHPALTIPVTINHATPAVVAAAGVLSVVVGNTANSTNSGINTTLRSDDPLHVTAFGMQPQGESGAWAIPNVTPGKYKLDIQASGNECVESAWYGGVDLLRDELVIGPDDGPQALTINASSDCATLTANVRAGGEKAGLYALLVVPQSGLGSPRMVMIPSERVQMPVAMGPGALSPLLILAPGSYDLYAFDNMTGLEYANPEALSGYTGKRIDLSAGQKLDVVLDPIERKGN